MTLPFDFSSVLLDPIYQCIGVPAAFTPKDQDGIIQFTAIDKTAGIPVQERGIGNFQLQTIKPGAAVRQRELQSLGLQQVDMIKGTVTLHYNTPDEKDWIIESIQSMPNPSGEQSGELMLILSEQ
jgi:hypothetical protein